jgi:hypothetical protein
MKGSRKNPERVSKEKHLNTVLKDLSCERDLARNSNENGMCP